MNGNKGSLKFFLFGNFIKLINFLFKKEKKVFPKEIKKILLIKADHIGDTIISTICLTPLSENYPNAKIDVVCGSWGEKTYIYQNKINKIYILDHIFLNRNNQNILKKLVLFLNQLKDLIPILRKEKYDICILLRAQLRGNMAIIAQLIKPQYIVGFKGSGLENILDCISNYNDFIPEKDNFLNLLENIPNFKIKNRKLSYEIVLPSKLELHKPMISKEKFNILINTEGYEMNRKIKAERIIEYLIYYKSKEVNIYIVSPPQSIDIEKVRLKIRELEIENAYVLEKVENIFELLYFIKKCDLLISVDSSILHLGGVIQKNIIGIYYDNLEKIIKFEPNTEKKYIVKAEKNSIRNIDMKKVIELTDKIIANRDLISKYNLIEDRSLDII